MATPVGVKFSSKIKRKKSRTAESGALELKGILQRLPHRNAAVAYPDTRKASHMTDIVDSMRARKLLTIEVDMHYPQIVDSDEADAECAEAADEITRLRAENERMRADLAYADEHARKVESLFLGTVKQRDELLALLAAIKPKTRRWHPCDPLLARIDAALAAQPTPEQEPR